MVAFQLENFNTEIITDDPTIAPTVSLEEHTLEAFEQGYKAGWDDAIESQKDDQKKISADFARNLQDLTFTLTEARSQVVQSITPLLEEMVHKVLPKLSMAGLAQIILDQVTEIAEQNANAQVEIMVSPINKPALEHLLSDNNLLGLSIVEEPSLAQGLATIRFAESEIKIDLSDVIQNFETALTHFISQQEKAV